MKRLIYFFLIIGFLHIVYGIYVSTWQPIILPTQQIASTENKFYDYAGAIHVQTNKSSGSGSTEEILREAKLAKLNFVVFTDFNDFNIDLNNEIMHEGVIAILGGKYSYLDARLLNFDMKTTEHLQGPGRSQVTFADFLSIKNTNRPEGLFFLAHPFKPGYYLQPPYPDGIDGIELINLKNIWQDSWTNSKASFIWNCFLYPFNSKLAYLRMLTKAGRKEISLWDELNKNGPTLGLFGSEAEARFRVTRNAYLHFPSYETLFSIVKNHLLIKSELTGNLMQDRQKISEALHRGQYYMSTDLIRDPTGFESYIRDQDNNIYPIGSHLPLMQNLELIIKLPQKPEVPFQINIHKDGEKILTSNSATTTYFIPAAGVYRVSVQLKIPLPFPERRRWMNWILTNPFYIL